MALSKEMDDSFNTIIDPETNMEVSIESRVGEQVIKNYIECLKNGPDSVNIVSTKMFYKNEKKGRAVKGICQICAKKVYSDEERIKKLGKYCHEKCNNLPTDTKIVNPKPKQEGSGSGSGSIKGKCGGCRKNVYSTEERVNKNGIYYHEKCCKPQNTTNTIMVTSTKNMGSIKGKCGNCNKNVYSTEERVNNNGIYYHEKCFK